jgi:hypothetical protein
VRAHFAEPARMMLISGTVFSPMRHVVVDMHPKATDRINGVQERKEAKRRERERERGARGGAAVGGALAAKSCPNMTICEQVAVICAKHSLHR